MKLTREKIKSMVLEQIQLKLQDKLNRAYDNGKTSFHNLLDLTMDTIKNKEYAEKVVIQFLNKKEMGMSNLS